MNNQEILANAPEGATHVDIDENYWHNSSAFYWLCCDYGSTCVGDVGNNTRSLDDIRRIVELEKERDRYKLVLISLKRDRSKMGFKINSALSDFNDD